MKRFELLGRMAAMAATVSLVSLAGNEAAQAFSLTILHNNDGESDLLIGDDGFGGVAQFVGEVNNIRNNATTDDVLVLSSGDNFLPGKEFNASLADGVFYDAIGLRNIGYDAIILGNHDFDFGPEILADFISEYNAIGGGATYLSANLDFSGEAGLQALVDNGSIAKSIVVEKAGEQIGIVGATTPNLPFIASPGNVVVSQDVQAAVQAEIDALDAAGVENIIFVSHLQGVAEDQELIAQLSGVDVAIAGGGDEILDSGDTGNLIPGDEGEVTNTYPITVTDADGNDVPVVTTAGQYRYVGQLVVEFENGVATVIEPGTVSDPVAVIGETDAATQNAVSAPVEAAVAVIDNNVIATSDVGLDGITDNIRSRETNLGNLIADSFLWQANEAAADFGLGSVDIALANGGGIRNDNVLPAGDLTEGDTFDILPFTNFLSVFEEIDGVTLKNLLENAVSRIVLDANGEPQREGDGTGRFAQIAGLSLEYNPELTALAIDVDGNITTSGERVINVTLDDGTAIIQDGQILPDAPSVSLAIVDFLARGGDQYPFGDASFTNLGVTYQQALVNYITDELGGVVSAADYPEGGEGRTLVTSALPVAPPVVIPPVVVPPTSESVPEPGMVAGLVGLGLFGVRRLKRQA